MESVGGGTGASSVLVSSASSHRFQLSPNARAVLKRAGFLPKWFRLRSGWAYFCSVGFAL